MGFNNLPANFHFRCACIGGGIRHDKPRASRFVERGEEQLNPEIVGVIHTGYPEGESRVCPEAFPVYARNIERRIRHHEVKLTATLMRVFVVTICLLNIAFESMHGEVHLAQADSLCHLFNAVDADVPGRSVLLVVPNEFGTLHEHSAGATRRIKDTPVKRLQHLNDEFHERGRREEFPTALSLTHRKVSEKILVDLPENIAFNVHGNLLHDAEQFKESALFKAIVSFRQYTFHLHIFALNRLHCIGNGLPDVRAFGQMEQVLELRLFREIENAAGLIRCLCVGSPPSSCRRFAPDFLFRLHKFMVGVS